MIRILSLLALCFWAQTALAGDFWFGPGAVSFHTDRGTRHNEVNGGLNAEYAWNEREALGVGVYRNSDWRTTHYLAYRWTPWIAGDFRLGGLAGIADGYLPGVIPIAGLVAVVEREHWGLNLFATPYSGGAVFALQIKWRLP